MYCILDEKNVPIPVDDVMQWAKWHDDHRDEPRCHMVTLVVEGVEVSTRFFGTRLLDRICMWETMVFVDGIPGPRRRSTTWDEAQQAHSATIERVKKIET